VSGKVVFGLRKGDELTI